MRVGTDIYGNKIVFRDFSTTGKSYPTLDLYKNGKKDIIMELKFEKE